jgi:hypothetical protein
MYAMETYGKIVPKLGPRREWVISFALWLSYPQSKESEIIILHDKMRYTLPAPNVLLLN